MHNFIRWYNQNRAQFFVIIAIIAFAFIMLQVLNSIVGRNNEQKKNENSSKNSSTSQSTTISKTKESVITGEKIGEQTNNKNQNTIKEFVQYCNDVKVENAYNMLTDECKELLYPTLKDFTIKYFLKVFDVKRTYNLENWFSTNNSTTYHITYIEDIMATGDLKSTSNISDYITVVNTNDGYKLNINSYVGRQTYGKTLSKDNVIIRINWIDQYFEYTIFNITVRNNTSKTICIDTKRNISTLYIYDENETIYCSSLNELLDEELIVESDNTKSLNIKFDKIYNPSKKITGIVFRDIVSNYEEYIKGNEKKETITIYT